MQDFEIEILKSNLNRELNVIVQSNDIDLFKSWSSDLQKQFPNGGWRTINGSHVFINNGKVIAGLDNFNGLIDDFFKQKNVETQKETQKPAVKETPKKVYELKYNEIVKHPTFYSYLKGMYGRKMLSVAVKKGDKFLVNGLNGMELVDSLGKHYAQFTPEHFNPVVHGLKIGTYKDWEEKLEYIKERNENLDTDFKKLGEKKTKEQEGEDQYQKIKTSAKKVTVKVGDEIPYDSKGYRKIEKVDADGAVWIKGDYGGLILAGKNPITIHTIYGELKEAQKETPKFDVSKLDLDSPIPGRAYRVGINEEVERMKKEPPTKDFPTIKKEGSKWITGVTKYKNKYEATNVTEFLDIPDSQLEDELKSNLELRNQALVDIARGDKYWNEEIVPKYGDREYNKTSEEAYSASKNKARNKKALAHYENVINYIHHRLHE